MVDASENSSSGGLPRVGELVADKYRLEGVLGRGGMGVVFAARHELLQQPVAIKFLGPNLSLASPSVTRFFNEARATARIQNDHVCRVLDFGVLETGGPYLVMERLEGRDLARVLAARGPLPIEQAIDYCLQALEVITEAHLLGIIHRDLKPANLFVAQRPDGSTRIKVLDFGVSKVATAEPSASITTTAAPLGSPAYMSPEQVRDPKSVDARTDLWSMGVILFELLAGRPFAGPTLGEIYAEILEREAPSVRARRPDVPAALAAAIAQCLRREREERHPDAASLAAALAPFGSNQARLSLERIEGMMRSARAAKPATSAGTNPALAETRLKATPASGSRWILVTLIAAALTVAAGLLFAHFRRAEGPAPVVAPPPITPAPPPPPPAVVPTPPVPAPAAAPPAASEPSAPARRRTRRKRVEPASKPPTPPARGILDDRQ